MRFQEQVIRLTQRALGDVVRALEALPPERLAWSPGGAARSALAQAEELAKSADFLLPYLSGVALEEAETHAEIKEDPGEKRDPEPSERLSRLLQGAQESTARFCAAVDALPESSLEEEVSLPFGEGVQFLRSDICLLHYWNLVYHLGQINYIQLMGGDREMH